MKPHKHCELIKQWADGAKIQYYCGNRERWVDASNNDPNWSYSIEYRIKPDPSNIETYDIEVGDIWLVDGNYLFVSDVHEAQHMLDGWSIQFCDQKGKTMSSSKSYLVDVRAELIFRRNGTDRLNEV